MKEHQLRMTQTRPFRVLLIDDQPLEIAQLKFLTWQLGIEVDVAFDGKQAWNLVRNREFDLIILDWIMPDVSGRDFLHSLENWIGQFGSKEICNRVVIHTGSPWEIEPLHEENVSILDIWQKPVLSTEVIKKLSKILIKKGA